MDGTNLLHCEGGREKKSEKSAKINVQSTSDNTKDLYFEFAFFFTLNVCTKNCAVLLNIDREEIVKR